MIKFNAVIIGLFSSFMANSPVFSNEPVQPESGDQISHKTTVNSNSFMLSAANPLAAKAGHEVLSRGGTAMDAAVAVQFVLNLVEPQSSGIGGGAFLLYWEQASQQLYTLDGRETAPASARPDQFLEADGTPQKWWKRITGGLSVGVPGTLRLLETAHKKFGNQTWSGLLQPAVELAENGFLVSPRMAHSIEKSADRGLKNFTPTRDYFFDDNGEPLVADHLLLNKEFAKTLRKIQISGATEFYAGSIGEALVNTVNNASANPASMTMQDLANYQVKFRPAVCGSYRGYQICGMGPPTSGGLTVAQILGMLDHHEISGTDFNAENVHLIVEAQKLAYADRAKYIADSDFVPVPAYGLLSSDYLAKRASLINRQSAMQKAEAGEPDWLMSADSYASIYHRELTGTSHFSIVDQYGNAVSMTTTIESGFGSRLMSGGFLLNNELTDFSALPEKDGVPVANRIEPGKRPRSSMAPTMIFSPDGNLFMVIGSSGGSRIINYVVKTIVAVIDFEQDIQSAIASPNFSNRNGPTDLEEESIASQWQKKLMTLGHEVEVKNLNSGLHGILRQPDGSLAGGADPRREGIVLGD